MKKNLEHKETIAKAKYFSIKRISPFLLLSIFLVLYLFFSILTNTITVAKYISFPFIIANTMFIDIALWNYFRGKKKGIIWITESLITALIIIWVT